MVCDSIDSGLDKTYLWCLRDGTDAEDFDESAEPDVDSGAVGEEVIEQEKSLVESSLGDKERKRMVDCLSNQRRVLKDIDGGNIWCYDEINGDHERSRARPDDRDSGGGRGGGEGMQLDLSIHDLLFFRGSSRPGNHRDPRHRFRIREIAFRYDLVGCLRRRIRGSGKKMTRTDDHPRTPSSPAIRHVRVCADFLRRFGHPNEAKDHLRVILMNCIADFSHMEKLHVEGCPIRVLYRHLKPVFKRRKRRRLKELRLKYLVFLTADEIDDFFHCFAPKKIETGVSQNGGWDNLTSLEIDEMLTFRQMGRVPGISLDPIIRAVGGGDLPRLETFRITPGVLSRYHADDDEAFVRLLTKRSIKNLALTRFIQPRHFRLTERHLSGQSRVLFFHRRNDNT